jgi:hypothetical protein
MTDRVCLLCCCQVRRHTEASAEELRRLDEQEEQLNRAGASELAVRSTQVLMARVCPRMSALLPSCCVASRMRAFGILW